MTLYYSDRCLLFRKFTWRKAPTEDDLERILIFLGNLFRIIVPFVNKISKGLLHDLNTTKLQEKCTCFGLVIPINTI